MYNGKSCNTYTVRKSLVLIYTINIIYFYITNQLKYINMIF